MIDDYKYSIGSNVVYAHPSPSKKDSAYGQYGPGRTVGVVRSVDMSDDSWTYLIENLNTGELGRVTESMVYYVAVGIRDRQSDVKEVEADHLIDVISAVLSGGSLTDYLKAAVREYVDREDIEHKVRVQGRDLPLRAGDYISIRIDIRPELGLHQVHYAKILEVSSPDVAAIESKEDVYSVLHMYHVLLDNGATLNIYDPEVKHYFTSEGRSIILNWRAVTFLADVFGDDAPYNPEYGFYEDHLYTRDELEALSREQLVDVLVGVLYAKGKLGLRGLQDCERALNGVPREYIVDRILEVSRFDMRKNRNLTPDEIESKRKQSQELRRLLDSE